jgi:NAD(P)-dependent dehydrogenase (short-subunit alcohol dehydrogenase family)
VHDEAVVDLRDKVVVITGAASGLGAACVRRFVEEGAKVVATDRDAEGIDRITAETGSVGLSVDITVEENVRNVADFARRAYGDVDVWFSNAGFAGPRQPGEIPDDVLWELGWRLHVMSHVYAARAVLPAMLARGDGYLLQTASSVALAVHTEKAAYSVSKHAALALAEWLAVTYRPQGIKVSCFCPAAMLTPMFLANRFPDGHPGLAAAVTAEDAAARLVRAIDDERFLIADAEFGSDVLAKKAEDYERWITDASTPRRS